MKIVNSFLNKIHPYQLKEWGILFIVFTLFGCQSQDSSDYQLLFEEKGFYLDVAWSPDGKQIVYRPLSEEPYYEILKIETNSTVSIPVPDKENSDVLDLVWISNEEIAYLEYSIESSKYTIAIYNLFEQSTMEFWKTDVQLFQICWLSIEQRLIVLATTSDLPFNITYGNTLLMYSLPNKDFRPIYNSEENKITDITCSLNENKIAFTELEDGLNNNNTWLYSITTTPPRDLLLLNETTFRVDSPSWSPDGDWVAVRSIKGTQSRQRRGLMLVSADGSKVHELEDVPWSRGDLVEVHWSPVGNTVLVRLVSFGFSPERFSLALFDIIPPPIQQEE